MRILTSSAPLRSGRAVICSNGPFKTFPVSTGSSLTKRRNSAPSGGAISQIFTCMCDSPSVDVPPMQISADGFVHRIGLDPMLSKGYIPSERVQ